MKQIAVAAVTASMMFAGAASAADMAAKAPLTAPPPQDWSGIYVGLEGGYGWSKQDLNAIFPGDCFIDCTVARFADVAIQFGRQNGWLFGGFAGAQKQWGNWVLGIEADFDAADIRNSAVATSATTSFFLGGVPPAVCGANNAICFAQTVAGAAKIDGLGSLRGKIGFAPAPNWLIYGTGGLGFAHVKNAFTVTETFQVGPAQVPIPSVVAGSEGGTSMLGWAAGAGVDWKWPADAGSAWVFGVEYLHYDFGTQTIVVGNNAGASSAFHSPVSVDAVKGRISYLFSTH